MSEFVSKYAIGAYVRAQFEDTPKRIVIIRRFTGNDGVRRRQILTASSTWEGRGEGFAFEPGDGFPIDRMGDRV